jgi:hypothetical protein
VLGGRAFDGSCKDLSPGRIFVQILLWEGGQSDRWLLLHGGLGVAVPAAAASFEGVLSIF